MAHHPGVSQTEKMASAAQALASATERGEMVAVGEEQAMVSSRVKSRTNDYRMKMLAKAGLLDDGELSDNETVATEITATTYCSSDDDPPR